MFSPSDFRELFQPNLCERRVWLAANCPELAVVDAGFVELVQGEGKAVEDAHVQDIGPVEIPEYPAGDLAEGFRKTCYLFESKTPLIYQGVLMSKDGQFLAIPDLLILDEMTGHYKIRDVKLAVNLGSHPEIAFGLGLCSVVAEEVLGYPPVIEVVKGDGQVVSPFLVPSKDIILECIRTITAVKNRVDKPIDPVGWSKCSPCQFSNHCWRQAWESRDVCTISGIEQGMSHALWENGINSWEDVLHIGVRRLADISFQRGSGTQRIGPTRADKIVKQARCLANNQHEKI